MADAKEQPTADAEPLREYLMKRLAEELLSQSDIQGKIDSVEAAQAATSFLLAHFEIARK